MKKDSPASRQLRLALLSRLGGLLFLLSLAFYMLCGADGLGTVVISALFLLTVPAAVSVAAGFLLPVIRKGQAAVNRPLVFGALAGGVTSLAAAVTGGLLRYESGLFLAAWIAMCAGCVICVMFGWRAMRPER